MPAASENWCDCTPTVAVPTPFGSGVKWAVYTSGLVLLCVKGPMVPPVTAMSPSVKLLLASLSVKVMSSPALLTVPVPVRVTTMVGAVVSVLYGKLTGLLASYTSPPVAGLVYVSLFRLLAASVNLPASTPTVPVPTLPALGVKTTL